MDTLKIRLDPWGIRPTRAHATDAGLDIYAPESFVVPAHGSTLVCTGIHGELPPGTVGIVANKSGLAAKHSITSSLGIIDEGYTGEWIVRLCNDSDVDYRFARGDKVSQVLVLPVSYPKVELVDEISGGERGDGGFGSTGR